MDACTDSDPTGSTLPLYHRLAARLESARRAGRISRLTMDRITHDSNGRVVEVASHLYRASRHEYTMTLVDRW